MTELVLDRERIRSLFDLRSEVYASRGGTFDVDPYPTFHRLRETGPVHEGTPHVELGWTGDVFFQGLPYPDRRHFTAYDYETCSDRLQGRPALRHQRAAAARRAAAGRRRHPLHGRRAPPRLPHPGAAVVRAGQGRVVARQLDPRARCTS